MAKIRIRKGNRSYASTSRRFKNYYSKPIDRVQNVQIDTLKKKVNKLENATETKYIDIPLNGAVAITNAVPLTYLMNGLVKGDDINQRNGNSAYMKYITLNINLYTSNNAFHNGNSVRIMLVKEKPCLGTALSLTSLFGTTTPYPWTTFENIQRDWKKRFKIFYDRIFSVDGITWQRDIRIRKKLNFTSNYARGNAGTVADIDTNSLALLILTDNSTANNHWIRFEAQIQYEDN